MQENSVLIFMPVDNLVINDYTGFDTWFNYYTGVPKELVSTYFSTIKKHKWPTVVALLDIYRPTFEQYKYVWFIDNDVKISNRDLHYFTKKCTEKEVQIAQMSLSQTNGTHRHLLYRGHRGFLRVKFCEVMAPLIRTDVLFELYEKGILSESESGWGIDYVWGKLFDNYLLQEVMMTHMKKVESTNWVMSNGKRPMQELELIKRKYKIR